MQSGTPVFKAAPGNRGRSRYPAREDVYAHV